MVMPFIMAKAIKFFRSNVSQEAGRKSRQEKRIDFPLLGSKSKEGRLIKGD